MFFGLFAKFFHLPYHFHSFLKKLVPTLTTGGLSSQTTDSSGTAAPNAMEETSAVPTAEDQFAVTRSVADNPTPVQLEGLPEIERELDFSEDFEPVDLLVCDPSTKPSVDSGQVNDTAESSESQPPARASGEERVSMSAAASVEVVQHTAADSVNTDSSAKQSPPKRKKVKGIF